MFRFEIPHILYLLLSVPIIAVLLFWLERRRWNDLKKFANHKTLQRLLPGLSKSMANLKIVLFSVALALLIVAWANPQWGNKKEKVQVKSTDIFIAMDISKSMLAQDIKPSRLDRGKKIAEELITKLRGERIGLIYFAGSAYLQMPVTQDYTAAMISVKSADPSQAGTQGTAFSKAIDLAQSSFSEENKYHKALIFITDGEDHDENAIETAKIARENGILIFTIGVGSKEGAPIPELFQGKIRLKKDKTGAVVQSKINENLLRDLANAGGGYYFNVNQGDQILEGIKASIDHLDKGEVEERSFTQFNSYFQYFAGMGLLLLFIEFIINRKSSKRINRKTLFGI